eukprot:2456274-Rhodomonas_salina.1
MLCPRTTRRTSLICVLTAYRSVKCLTRLLALASPSPQISKTFKPVCQTFLGFSLFPARAL